MSACSRKCHFQIYIVLAVNIGTFENRTSQTFTYMKYSQILIISQELMLLKLSSSIYGVWPHSMDTVLYCDCITTRAVQVKMKIS